jgi:predicted Zn-dependent protease
VKYVDQIAGSMGGIRERDIFAARARSTRAKAIKNPSSLRAILFMKSHDIYSSRIMFAIGQKGKSIKKRTRRLILTRFRLLRRNIAN